MKSPRDNIRNQRLRQMSLLDVLISENHKQTGKQRTRVRLINPLTPNDHYRGRTAPLTSKRCILYIYSTNIGTEYFKRGIYSRFFSSKYSLVHNSNVFVSCNIHILYTGVLKLKNNSGAKRFKHGDRSENKFTRRIIPSLKKP
jgi:hypothetical protein